MIGRGLRWARLWALMAMAAACPGIACAADATPPAPENSWIVSVGIDGRLQPRFIGSSDDRFFPYPVIAWPGRARRSRFAARAMVSASR